MSDPIVAGPIVVGVDSTPASLDALLVAAERATDRGVPLLAVHVRHTPSAASIAEAGEAVAPLEATLDEIEATTRGRVQDLLAGRHLEWRLDVRAGDPATELIAEACEHHADGIVVGGRSHGVVAGLVLGSVAQKLVRKSPVSVLVVRHGDASTFAAHAPMTG